MRILVSIALFVFCAAGLTACGDDEVSWNTQETQRAIAIQNSEYNAKAFRQKNSKYSGLNIVGRGDSTISADCANGDGWASVDFISDKGQKIAIKCSTASATIGCFVKSDFDSKSYASQEGSCNRDLPVPMPKIVK